MIPGEHDFRCVAGDTFRPRIRLRERELVAGEWVDGDYLDLTGFTGKSQVRQYPGADSLEAEAVVTVLDQVEVPGGVTLLLTSEQTMNLGKQLREDRDGVYHYSIRLSDPDGNSDTYLRGQFIIEPSETL